METLDRRELLAVEVIDLGSEFKAMDFTAVGGYSGGTVVNYASSPKYQDSFRGTSTEVGTMHYTSPTQGRGDVGTAEGGVNEGTGRENYRPGPKNFKNYAYTFTGSGEISDADGVLHRANGYGRVHYTSGQSYSESTPYSMDSTGTVNISMLPFQAAVQWSEPVDDGYGTGTTWGSWSGTVTPTDTTPLDLLIAQLEFDEQGDLNVAYTMPGRVHPSPTHTTPIALVGLYWATGPSLADRIPSEPPLVSLPVYWNQLNGAFAVRGIEDIPSGATHVIAMIDDANAIEEPDETNNVMAVPFAWDLVPTKLEWNTQRESDPAQRGLDFAYSVAPFPTVTDVKVSFYWARGETFDARLGAATSTRAMSGEPGDHGDFNESARWGVPPVGATHVLLVLDPDDDILETDESNNVMAIELHSPEEILADALSLVDSGTQVDAMFEPAGGQYTMSEAEVALGVDHFNWLQYVEAVPGHWTIHRIVDSVATELPTPLLDPDNIATNADQIEVASTFAGRADRLASQTLDASIYYLDEPDEVRQSTSDSLLAFSDAPIFPDDFLDVDESVGYQTVLVGVGYAGELLPLPGAMSFRWESNSVYDSSGGQTGIFLKTPGDTAGLPPTIAGGIANLRPDNDLIVELEAPGPLKVNESGQSTAFSVVLSGEPQSDVVVKITLSDPGEASVDLGELTFTPADWDAPQTVTVAGVDDPIQDGPQLSKLTVEVDKSVSDSSFDAVNPREFAVLTGDNDKAPVANANGPYTVDEAADYVALTGQGSFDADNPGDPLTYDWDLDYDGTSFDVDVSDDPAPWIGPFDDSGVRTIALRVTNGRGAASIATAVLTVKNVAPMLFAELDDDGFDGVVGQDRTLVLEAYDDSTADTEAGFTYEVDWGDGSPHDIFSGPAETNRSHAYSIGGAYTIQVWARDKDQGQSDPKSIQVNILATEQQGNVLAIGGTATDDVLTVDLGKSSTTPSIKLNTTALPLVAVTHIKFFGSAGTDTVRLSGTTGNDVFTITSQGVTLGLLQVEASAVEKYDLLGGKGTNTLVGPNQVATWEITGKNAGTLTPATSAPTTFKDMQELQGGAAADRFRLGSKGSLTGKTDGQGGDDTLDFGLRTKTVTVNLQTFKATGGIGGFLGIETFLAGTGKKDVFTGPDAQNTWSLTGADQAVLNGVITLTGFESLNGGAGQDEFHMGPSGALTGSLDGKGGTNILSYAGRSASVTLALGKSKQSGASIGGKLTNFAVLVGGDGDDTLTGNAKTSTAIVGGGGKDILIGGSARDILMGGLGADTLSGGTGANKIVGGSGTNEDLLIGGGTAHDGHGSALVALLAEWNSVRSYSDRVANLRGPGAGDRANGNVFLQNAPTDTLFDDAGGIDTLTGALGDDYFIAGTEDSISDLVAGTELVDNP